MKIYLAGPDVFRENAVEHLETLKVLCKKYGFTGLAPLDNIIEVSKKDAGTPVHSNLIFKSNVELIKECDVVIANLVPFRGACIDDGTAWEIGMVFALGKIIYGYTSYKDYTLSEVTNDYLNLLVGRDDLGEYTEVENFGNCVNLMISDSIKDSGASIEATFEDCLISLLEKNKKSEEFFQEVLKKESNIIENYLDKFGEDLDSEDNFYEK